MFRSFPRPAYARGFGGSTARSAVARRAKAESGNPEQQALEFATLGPRFRGDERR